ncbi:predicted protein [Thalassiosira pseudonana CCMP1335]|nr:predicted protein [Thalassiosira pseudonana CCMP1335]EED89210.1 predicted protein [Thalassiosira pseudonana CCMP1335]
MITTDLFINSKDEFSIKGPGNLLPIEDAICGHLAIWKDDPSTSVNVHGTEVPKAWGFVMNFLNWGLLKDRSNIYQRFADFDLEFELSRVSEGAEPTLLAESSNSKLLDDSNSVVIETETMNGVWQNRVGTVNGWEPAWYLPAIIGVAVASFLFALLTASTLVKGELHRNLLYKVMPRRAIAKLHRGQTVLEKFNLVTIFFSDIIGFTSITGNMNPIQVMKMLNELYTELDKLVEKHQVYKVETVGDSYMVVGGAPDRVPAPLAAERVALFAIDAIELVKNFSAKDGDQIFIRAGLASGPTVAGVVGSAMPRYCFFGDTVNLASTMERTSKKMKIQVAEITYRLLQDAPNINFQLKKRSEGVDFGDKGLQNAYWVDFAYKRDLDAKAKERLDEPMQFVDIEANVSEYSA